MTDFIIHEPIWKTKSVGLAEYRLEDTNTVKILYKSEDGTYPFPNSYTVSKETVLKYPIMMRGTVQLRIIPIAHMEEEKL
jgi:hypothetical protein